MVELLTDVQDRERMPANLAHGSMTSGEPVAASILRITILICTFRRPQGLAAALRGIDTLTFRMLKRPQLRVVVVDNEGDPGARATVGAFARHDLPATYVVEPRRGISHARNACLDHVPADADYVAWLDDDVVPRPDWLEKLVFALETTGAEAATGPYVPVYEAPTPEWIRAGRFFASPRAKQPRELEQIQFGTMGNIIFRASFLRSHHVRFDEELSLVGGEDRKFFRELLDKGGRFVWTSEAVVDHHISAERLTLRYIVRREFAVGCVKVILRRIENKTDSAVLPFALQVFAELGLKILLWMPMSLLALLDNNAYALVKPTLDVANISGRLYGLLGHKYQLYK